MTENHSQPTSAEEKVAPKVQAQASAEAKVSEDVAKSSSQVSQVSDAEMDFASMLAASSSEVGVMDFEIGQTVEGPIVQVGQEFAYVDLGAKGEAFIAISELQNPEDGKLVVGMGDNVKAKIVRFSRDGVLLSKASHAVGNIELEEAFAAGTPVKAKVVGKNKAGLECEVMGRKAFCPASQIDVSRVDDFDPYIGNSYEFKIIKYERYNMVLSRSALLRAQHEAQREVFLEKLAVSQVYAATVMRLERFGAFVRLHDSGGIEGLVHISELSYEKVSKVEDLLKIGDEIRVTVIDIKPSEGKDHAPRIALSIKQLSSDPYDEALQTLRVGQRFTGKVDTMLKFGALVEIMPGVRGLLHHSEFSWQRSERLERSVSPGDEIEVSIISIDPESRRIGLSSKQLQSDPWDTIESSIELGEVVTGEVESIVEFGVFVGLPQGVTALLPLSEMPTKTAIRALKKGDKIEAKCIDIDLSRKRLTLSQKEDAEVRHRDEGGVSNRTQQGSKEGQRNGRGSKRRRDAGADRASYRDDQGGFGSLGDLFGKLKS